MHNPPHPGEVLRDGVFTDTGITVTEFAKRIGVTRVMLSRMLNGKAGISADMAHRCPGRSCGKLATHASELRPVASTEIAQASRGEDRAAKTSGIAFSPSAMRFMGKAATNRYREACECLSRGRQLGGEGIFHNILILTF